MQGHLEARFTVALPARGRTILSSWAAQILVSNLPRSARTSRCAADSAANLLPFTAIKADEDPRAVSDHELSGVA